MHSTHLLSHSFCDSAVLATHGTIRSLTKPKPRCWRGCAPLQKPRSLFFPGFQSGLKLSGSHLHSQALQFSSIFSVSKCGRVLCVLESLTSFLQYYLFLFLFSPASNSSPALRGWRDYTGSGLIFLFKVSGSVVLYPSAESFPAGLRFVFDQIITKRES